MENNKDFKLLSTHGRYDLVVCRDEKGHFVYGLREDGKLILTLTESDKDIFYERVGMVSRQWERWLTLMPADMETADGEAVEKDDRQGQDGRRAVFGLRHQVDPTGHLIVEVMDDPVAKRAVIQLHGYCNGAILGGVYTRTWNDYPAAMIPESCAQCGCRCGCGWLDTLPEIDIGDDCP